MNTKEEKKKKRLDKKRAKLIKRYERKYASHKYDGKGKKFIDTLDGKSVIAITAPHSVNCFDIENRKADILSGGISRLLIKETGCHGICIKKKYSENQRSEMIEQISDVINRNGIKLILDIQVYETENDSLIDLFSYTNSEKYRFVSNAIRYSFEYKYRKFSISKIVNCLENEENDICLEAAKRQNISHVKIGLNKKFCNLQQKENLIFLYHVLYDTIVMLSQLDWSAECICAFRLWQSAAHKPQDKIELFLNSLESPFEENDLLNVRTYGTELEQVRLHKPEKGTKSDIEKSFVDCNESILKEYVFLTNRLIEILFGREWIEVQEEDVGLKGAPIIIYKNAKDIYPIGLPKANRIDGVFFSSALYEEKEKEASAFDFVIFNRYTDSRLYIKFEKADYEDFGRVKDSNGNPAKKVMIPRYYKRLLGYLDYPLRMIRSEEYSGIIKRLSDEIERAGCNTEKSKKLKKQKKAFETCYEKIDGEVFYKLKNQYAIDRETEVEPEEEIKKTRDLVINAQMKLLHNAEILRIPKEIKPKEKLYKRFVNLLNNVFITILKKVIGKSEYLLKTEWTNETDDKNNIARLSSNMMSLLGVSENDKILIKFGKKQEVLRVLADDKLSDYQIGIPAPARKSLGMNSINDIVIVHRDMIHIFWRHSEQQTIAILGTVLAVFQVVSEIWIGMLLCIILTPLIMYFVLNEERVQVK